MNKKLALLLLAIGAPMAAPVFAGETLTDCAGQSDDRLRLACYDKLSTRQRAVPIKRERSHPRCRISGSWLKVTSGVSLA